MTDETPHRRDVFLNDRTKTRLWVEWQRRRWHVDYGPAAATCLQAMSLHLLSRSFTTADEERQHRQTLENIATLNARLRHYPGDMEDDTLRWVTPRLGTSLSPRAADPLPSTGGICACLGHPAPP